MVMVLAVMAVMAAMMAAMAMPAFAKNIKIGDGPPVVSGGGSTFVVHCNSDFLGGTRGNVVVNENGFNVNNCDSPLVI